MKETFKPGEGISEQEEIINDTRGALNELVLDVKKESVRAEQELKDEIKRRGFYNGDENGENIKFNISKVKEYLQKIRNKSWTDLEVRSSKLEKGVRTIAIQIAINYINMKNGESAKNIDWIDGIRGNKTWKGVKEFQTKYGLKNKDGLPGRETINKILELLGDSGTNVQRNNETGLGKNEKDKRQENDESNDGKATQETTEETTEETKSNFRYELNNSNIDNNKCVGLLKGLKLNVSNNEGMDTDGNDFKNRLIEKIGNKGGIEGTIFKNPEIQKFLNSIISREEQEIKVMKLKYLQNKQSEKNNQPTEQTDEKSEKDKVEPVESWEDFRAKNFSRESFEEFILSDDGIAIILDEIKSHIDTKHVNENGEYDRFYDNYPISEKNLEIKLKTAWKNKMHWDYNTKNGIYDKNKEEEMEKLDVISNRITGKVDEIIGNYIKSGKDNFDQDITKSLESLLLQGTNGVPINEFFSDQDQKDTFKVVLQSRIKEYGKLVNNQDNVNLDTGDKQINLQLKSYLYVYGRIFYTNYFSSNKDPKYYENILPDVMKIIMSNDDKSFLKNIQHRELLAAEKKIEEQRKKNDLARRQRIAKRNMEINSRSRKTKGELGLTPKTPESSDVNDLSGAQIVSANVNLDDYSSNIDLNKFINTPQARGQAFSMAWNKIKNDDIIKRTVTPKTMRSLFSIDDSGNVRKNEDARRTFFESDDITQEEKVHISSILESFPTKYEESLKYVGSILKKQESKVDNDVKNNALGSVIDNVRDIFNESAKKWEGNPNFQGFKLNVDNPVIREGNNIIISGTFNGSIVKIRYDLDSGGLFMNSFLQHKYNPPKIVIGNNDDASLQIGQLDSFDKILDEHYQAPDISFNNNLQYSGNQSNLKPNLGNQGGNNQINKGTVSLSQNNKPQNSRASISGQRNQNINKIESIKKKYMEMLDENLDVISDAVIDNTNKQSTINSVVVKFMKTFNIIVDGQEDRSFEFNEGSNLFDFLQIIENSDPSALERFQLFMERVSNFALLKWGSNNINGSQRVFEENYDNENMNLLRDSIKSFSKDSYKFMRNNIQNFTSEHQLGFIQIIKENLTDRTGADMRLNSLKIDNFIKDFGKAS